MVRGKGKGTVRGIHLSHEEDEWGTPCYIIEKARELMGSIDTDPSSDEIINRLTVKAKTFYTKKDNGLAQPWYGNVWLNPPFELKDRFALLAHSRFSRGDIKQAMFLTSLNSVAAIKLRVLRNYPLIILPGRQSFIPMNGQALSQNSVATVIYYFAHPENFDRLEEVFGEIADIRYSRKCLRF
jgi:hypothetical protein